MILQDLLDCIKANWQPAEHKENIILIISIQMP